MNYKIKLVIGFVLLGMVLVVGCGEESVFSFTRITNNHKIIQEFNKAEWVPVLVRLKDNSGLTIEGTKEQRVAILKQRDEWFGPKIKEVISTLSKEEFELADKRFDGFRGKITKKGFEKLLSNPAVEKIIPLTEGQNVHTVEN